MASTDTPTTPTTPTSEPLLHGALEPVPTPPLVDLQPELTIFTTSHQRPPHPFTPTKSSPMSSSDPPTPTEVLLHAALDPSLVNLKPGLTSGDLSPATKHALWDTTLTLLGPAWVATEMAISEPCTAEPPAAEPLTVKPRADARLAITIEAHDMSLMHSFVLPFLVIGPLLSLLVVLFSLWVIGNHMGQLFTGTYTS